jgi:Fic family protein
MYSIAPTYLWQTKDFPVTPILSEHFFEKAAMIKAEEKRLFAQHETKTIEEALANALTQAVTANWAIEGIVLNTAAVRSSIIRECGMSLPVWTSYAFRDFIDETNAVKVTLDFLRQELKGMTSEELCRVNGKLAPMIAEPNEVGDVRIHGSQNFWGKIRTTGIQVVNQLGEAAFIGPEPQDIPKLLHRFSSWWNAESCRLPAPIFAALAHLYFVNIHPFGDGNGRTARILAEKAITGNDKDKIFRPYSLTSEIMSHRSMYYTSLDKARQIEGISQFIDYILDRHMSAIKESFNIIQRKRTLKEFFERYNDENFSPEQKRILEILLESGNKEKFSLIASGMNRNPDAASEMQKLENCGFLLDGLIPSEKMENSSQHHDLSNAVNKKIIHKKYQSTQRLYEMDSELEKLLRNMSGEQSRIQKRKELMDGIANAADKEKAFADALDSLKPLSIWKLR